MAVALSAKEAKTRTPIDFALPELLLPYLDVYLKIVRPRILNDPKRKALWVSPKGRHYAAARSEQLYPGTLRQ